jgi:DNA polymerase III alpha subunit
MPDITPLFSTAASRTQGGVFTVEKAGETKKAKRTRGPVSLCDLVKAEKLTHIQLVEANLINFMNAYKNLKEVGCNLSFGLKLTVCESMTDKSEASLKTESNVVVWMAGDGSTDYQRLIKLFTVAANDGFYHIPRIDWKTLCALWGDDLLLSLPFYSSFLAKNTLTFSCIVPELPTTPLVLREVDQQLPVDDLIDAAIERYTKTVAAEVQLVKSLYYMKRNDAKAWQNWRCILKRTSFDKPNLDGCCSREFAYEAYKELIA